MFAVPGWSVSADTLKTQTEQNLSLAQRKGLQEEAPTAKKSKKRKRGSNGVQVTQENVGDLYRQLIEGKGGDPGSEQVKEGRAIEKEEKRRKRKKGKEGSHPNRTEEQLEFQGQKLAEQNGEHSSKQGKRPHENGGTKSGILNAGAPPSSEVSAKRDRKKEKRKRKEGDSHTQTNRPPDPAPTTAAAPPSFAPPTNPNLTPLQQKMAQKLLSARFRHLNETLYTTPAAAARTLFATDPSAFATYHSGFRAQVAQWPASPLDAFIEELRARSGVRVGRGKGPRPLDNGGGSGPLPREPRTHRCRVADLGCGEARLAAAVAGIARERRLDVKSYDLAQPEGPEGKKVTVADVSDLRGVGVRDGGVEVVVCCLSLMGTDWVKVVDECGRVVCKGGEAWVAEIQSRFRSKDEVERMRKEREAERKKGKKGKSGKGGKGAEGKGEQEEGEEARIFEEIDGVEDGKKDEIDVGAFVEVWRRRGFELKATPDLANKMFIKMQFVKVGEGARRKPDGQEKPRFIDADDGHALDPEEEGRILKPCVYKTR